MAIFLTHVFCLLLCSSKSWSMFCLFVCFSFFNMLMIFSLAAWVSARVPVRMSVFVCVCVVRTGLTFQSLDKLAEIRDFWYQAHLNPKNGGESSLTSILLMTQQGLRKPLWLKETTLWLFLHCFSLFLLIILSSICQIKSQYPNNFLAVLDKLNKWWTPQIADI